MSLCSCVCGLQRNKFHRQHLEPWERRTANFIIWTWTAEPSRSEANTKQMSELFHLSSLSKLLGYIRIQVLLNCLIDKVEGNTGKRHELCRWRNLQSSMQLMCLEACASQESSKDCIWTWSGRLMASNAKPEEDHPPWGNFFRNA